MATAPEPGASRRADAHISISVDGTVYTMRPSELSAVDGAKVRAQTGMSLRSLLSAAETDPDLDVIAAVVWLARRQAGEKITFDEVAEAIGYDAKIAPVETAAAEDEDSPEV